MEKIEINKIKIKSLSTHTEGSPGVSPRLPCTVTYAIVRRYNTIYRMLQIKNNKFVKEISSLTRKCYSNGRAKANSTQAALHRATTLGQIRLCIVQ